MNVFIGMTRYALPVLAFIILFKCVITLVLGHPANKTYAYIIDAKTGEKLPLNMWETSLGSGKSCDIQLSGEGVSASQAVISRRADGWYIFDTVSRGGTSVNGVKAEKRTLIKHGDRIRFADNEYIFSVADDPVITVGGKKKRRQKGKAAAEAPAPVSARPGFTGKGQSSVFEEKTSVFDEMESQQPPVRKPPVQTPHIQTPSVQTPPVRKTPYVGADSYRLDPSRQQNAGQAGTMPPQENGGSRPGQPTFRAQANEDVYSDSPTKRAPFASPAAAPSGYVKTPALINLKNNEIYVLNGTYISIGRAPACDIRFPQSNVSRTHAALKKYSDGWAVLDTQSKAGTTLNGETINAPQLLFDGDMIGIGSNKLEYISDYKGISRG